MTKTDVRPLGENILVKPEKAEKKTSAGIYLPENASEERPQQGKVIAIGDSDKIKVKKGQTVIYARYGGSEVKIDGEDFLIVSAKDLLAVIEG
ncbi:MAG: co-chaperone GroES [Candidatus Moranbacteria bacterium]|nr:co-chaperone GroES [Candidatus Moranbacteria bacterium]NTW45533.1 co-chaperone GroES [Candidatus Moranbacteria bacterium]